MKIIINKISSFNLSLLVDNKLISKTIPEFINLIEFLSLNSLSAGKFTLKKAYIPPPAPPKSCVDLELIERQITSVVNWIEETTPGPFDDTIKEFLSEFHYNPEIPKTSWKKASSMDFLFFQRQVKEIDVYFEQCKIWLQDWEVLLASFGRTNEALGTAQKSIQTSYQGLSESAKDSAQKLLHLSTAYMPTKDQRKAVRYYESSSKLSIKDGHYRLNALNDELIVLLKYSSIAGNALDYRFKCLEDYEYSCKETQKRLIAMEKLRTSSNIKQEKVDSVLEEMAVIKKTEQDAKENFKSSSETVKKSFIKFQQHSYTQLSRMIDDYVAKQIDNYELIISELAGL